MSDSATPWLHSSGSPCPGILCVGTLCVAAFLQGFFLTWIELSGLLHWRQISLPTEPWGKPYCGWALSKQRKSWTAQKTGLFSSRRKFCQRTAFRLYHIFNLLTHPTDFGSASLYNCVSQPLIINKYKHTRTHTSYWFYFLKNPK